MWTDASVSGAFSPALLTPQPLALDVIHYDFVPSTSTANINFFNHTNTSLARLASELDDEPAHRPVDWFAASATEANDDEDEVAPPETVPSSPATSPLSSGPSSPTGGVPVRDEKYLRKRKNNNEAATRSRAKRRQTEKDNAEKVVILSTENVALKAKLEKFESENAYLRSVLASFANAETKIEV